MTKVGKPSEGVWPEHPILDKDIKEGDTVRYPQGGYIVRGTVQLVHRAKYEWAGLTVVHFTDGGWCYGHEVSEDKD